MIKQLLAFIEDCPGGLPWCSGKGQGLPHSRSEFDSHHGDNRGRHSANHNLLPDMHLSVPVLRVTTCLIELVQDVMEIFGNIVNMGSI